MAMAELPKPGVEVIQEFTTRSPTIAAPRLVPCIVGVCKQILEITNSDGTINTDAAVSAPAVANADIAETYLVNGETLSLAIDGGPTQTKTIDTGTGAVTAQTLANAINAAGFTGVRAYVWVDPSGNNRLQLRTTSSGSSRSISFKGGSIDTILGWDDAIGYTWYGVSTYTQSKVFLPQEAFPDPRSIMDDLDIDETTVNCYVDLGSSIQELTNDSTFLYGDFGAGAIAIYNDADGDSTTPFVDLEDSGGAVNFNASPTAAAVTGTGDIGTALIRCHNQALALELDGGGMQVITLYGKPIVSNDTTGIFPYTSTLTLWVNGVSVPVTLTAAADLAAIITAINTATQTAVGYDVAYASDATGLAAASTYLGLYVGADPTTLVPNTEVRVTAAGDASLFTTTPVYQENDDTGLAGAGIDPIQTQINNAMNETIATAPSNYLVLTSNTSGHDSKIKILGAPNGDATLLTALGLTAGSYYGTSFKAHVGDTVYADNQEIGTITEVHPGGVTGRLRVSPEVAITATWSSWYIIAQNLDDYSSEWGTNYPYPDFYLDTAGDAHIKHDFLRDALGAPLTGNVGLYLTYQAVRKDVTSEATTGTPALVVFEDVDELEEAIGPIQPSNPLAYGIFMAMSNAANTQITGLGVAEISAGEPYGTLTAWGKALDFLETEEVYAIAIMDDNPLVHQLAKTHVDAMSAPAQKGERVAIICQDRPTREYDSIAVSGTDGESTAAGKFDTKQPLLTAQLQAAGLNPASLSATDGVFLDVESDNYRWNITSIEGGTVVVINQTFGPGENDDNFYEATATPPDDLVNETFSVKIRGAAIPDSTAGRNLEVETYVNIGQGYSDRRVWHLISNGAYASVDGVISLVEGFFLCAAKAGQVAGNLPSAPLTNFGIGGFTGVVGTNDRYTEVQLNQIAYGGNDIIIQPGEGSPLVSRHQLTTNMTSIEVREQSIVKAVDFCAKFIRGGLRNFIGKYNITETFLDTLSTVVQGQIRYLSDNGVIAGGDLNNIIQDTTNPDTVLVDVTIEVLYPCNYIRVTLII